MDYRKLLTPRWIITTLLVLVAVWVMARLGFWQLDRLVQRKAINAATEAQINAPALDLNQPVDASGLTGVEYRKVTVRGTYDPQNDLLLRNQVYDSLPGYHLLTPLHISGSQQSIYIDRGFIPLDQGKALAQYAQPGEVTVTGRIKLPFVPKIFGAPDPTLAPGQQRLDTWNYVNMPRIQQQTGYALLPVIVEAAPSGTEAGKYPVATLEEPDLSEGPHLGYAVQWFSFAAILALGYPFFIKKQFEAKPKRKGAQSSKGEGIEHEISGSR